jgi:hypothetical protein
MTAVIQESENRLPALPDNEPNDLGEAMKALPSDRWRAFVRHYTS